MIRHSRSNSSSVSSSKCSSQSKVNSTLIEMLGQERGNYSNEETNANNCSSLRDENTLKFIQSFLNSNQKDMNNQSYFSAHQATSSTNYLSVWESSIASQHVQSVSAWNINRLNDLQDAQKVKEKQLDFLKQQLQKEQDKNEENNARILEMIEREEMTKEQLQEQIQEGQGIQRRQGIQEQFIRKEQLIASLKWIKDKVMQKWNSSRESRENHNSIYPYNSQPSSLQADRVLQWIKFEEIEKREIGSILRALADKEEAFYVISNAEEKLNYLRESIQMNEEELVTIQQRQLSLASEYECMESWLDLAKQSSDKMIQQQINLRQVWFCLVQESHNYKILIIQGQDRLKGMSEKLEQLNQFKRNIQKTQLQNTNKQNNQAIIWSKNELLEELKAREILKRELTFAGKQALERIEELFSGQLSGKEAVYDAKNIFYANHCDFLSNESQNNQEKDFDSSKIAKQSQEQVQRWKGVLEALQCVVIAEVKDYFDDVLNLRLKQAESDETTIGSSKQKNQLMESSNLQGDLLARCQSSLHVRRELNSLLSELLNIENRKIIAESVKSILIARRGDFSRQFDISANQAEYDWKEGKVQEQLNQISIKIQNQTSIIQQYTHKLDSIVNQLHVLDTQTFPFFQISAPLDMPEGLQFFDDSPNLNLTALNLTYKMPRSSMENTIHIQRDKDVEEIQKNIKNKDSRYYSEQFKRKNQVDMVFKRLAEIQWSNSIDKINLSSVTVQLTQNKKKIQDMSKFIEDKASAIIHLNKLLQRMGQGLAQLYLCKLTEEETIKNQESNFNDSQITRDCSAETLEKILGKDENMSDGMSFLFSGETLNPGVKLKILHCELERNDRERMSLKKKQEELVLPLNLEISKYEEMICNLQNQAHVQQLQLQQNPQGNQQNIHNGNYNPQQQQQVSPGSMGIEKGRNLTLSDINDVTNEQKIQYSSANGGGITHTPQKQDNQVLQSSLLKLRGSNSLSSKQQTITSSSHNNNQFFLDYYKSNNPNYVERKSHLNNQSSSNNSGSSISSSQRVSSSKLLRQFLEFPLTNEDKENLIGNQQEYSQEMQIFKKFQINSGNLLGKSGLYDVLDSKQKHPLFCGYGLRTVKIEGDCFLFVNSKTKQIELSVKRNESNNVFLPPVTFDIIKAKLQLLQAANSQCLQQAPLPMSQTTKKLLEVQFIPIALELKNKGRIECLVESLVQLKQLYGLFRCFIENNHHNFNTFS